jgi:hypothetical protein
MRNEPGPSVVYAIGTIDGATIKIGTTTNLPKRFAAIQAMSPQQLVVHWHTLGGGDLERHLHTVFKARRQHGEWFDFRDEDALRLVPAAAKVHADAVVCLGERTTRSAQQQAKMERVDVARRRPPTAEREIRVPCLPMCPEYQDDPARYPSLAHGPSCDLRKRGCLTQVWFLALLGSGG